VDDGLFRTLQQTEQGVKAFLVEDESFGQLGLAAEGLELLADRSSVL
jgi:hypothetical protein